MADVWPFWDQIKQKIDLWKNENEADKTKILAKIGIMTMDLKEKIAINKFHKMAVLLNPKRRSLKNLATADQRLEVS